MLQHLDLIYQGQIENISLKGALISFDDGVVVPNGEDCRLTIDLDGLNLQLHLFVKIVHTTYTMLGVQFISCDITTQEHLFKLIEGITPYPEKLREEIKSLAFENI